MITGPLRRRARKHFLGKTVGKDLLRVIWTSELGGQDSVALWVRDLDAWLLALGS